MKVLRFGLLIFSMFLFSSVLAQNIIIDPSTDGGFEGNHGWTVVNATGENKWFIGSAEKTSGSNGAYVSNNISSQAITSPQSISSAIYIYKDVVVPANATSISLSFKFKNTTNTTNTPRIFFAKTSEFVAPNTNALYTDVTTITKVLANQPSWSQYTNTNPLVQDRTLTFTSKNLEPGESYRILFEWTALNQSSYTQTSPVTKFPVNARIVSSAANYTPGGTITNTLVWDQDGQNYGIYWWIDGGAVVQSGQGTRTMVAYHPLGLTGIQTYRAKFTAPTPTFQFNGVNGGMLAIDEVSLTYLGVPNISSVGATSGEVGSNVVINGEFFDAVATNNIVYLGGVKCTVVSGNSTSLTVTIPAHAKPGYFTVTTSGTKLTAVSPKKFIPINTGLLNAKYFSQDYTNNAFEAPVAFSTAFPSSFDQKYALADVNLDGKLDVLSYGTDGVPRFLRNTATAGVIDASTFASVSSITGVTPAYSPNSSRSILSADLNNDGKADFAVSNNINNGGFVTPNNSANNSVSLGAGSSLLTSSGSYKVNGAFLPVDLNRDGRIDVFGISATGGSVRPFYSKNNTANNGFSFSTLESTSIFDFTTAYGGDYGDIDGNGTQDVVYSADGFVMILENRTRRGTPFVNSFSLARAEMLPISDFTGKPYVVKLVDIDGDGSMDIVATNSVSNFIHIWRKTATGFSVAPRIDIRVAGLSNTSTLTFGDLNGDGKTDLIAGDLVSGIGTKIGYLENSSTSGNISFKDNVLIYQSANTYQHLELVDIDGDRKPDIVGANTSNNTLDVFRNRVGESGGISGDATVCAGNSTVLISSSSPGSVVSGSIVYSWQKSTTSATSGYSTIAGETNATLSPGVINQTTFFRRGIASSNSPATVYYSLPVKITVSALPTITVADDVTICGTGTVPLKAETSQGDGSFVKWYDAATGGNLLGRVASGAVFTTPAITSNTTFYAEAESAAGCVSSSREPVAGNLNLALPTVTVGSFADTKCDAGDFTLSASTSSEAVVRWYDAATGGTLLREGDSFTTPVLNTTTTYYVEANNCNGSSVRQAVTLTIVPTPTITSAPNVSACQYSNVTLAAQASAGSLNWYIAATGGTPNVSNATIVNLNAASTLRYVSSTITVNNVTCESPRTTVTLTMNNLPTHTATNSTIYGETTGTVSVSSVTGTSVNWYSDAAATQLLVAGNNQYTSPVIKQTTTYYAVSTNLTTGCVSVAIPATVTYSGPTFNSLSNAFATTNQQNFQIKAFGLASYSRYDWQRSSDGGNTWTTITSSNASTLDANITYTGFNGTSGSSATLNISTADSKLHGYLYRILLTGTSSAHTIPTNVSRLTVADIYGTCTTGTQNVSAFTNSSVKTGLTNLSNQAFSSNTTHLSDGNLSTGMVVQNTNTYSAFTGSTPSFTIEAWVKISSSAYSINTIVGKKTPNLNTAGYAFYVNTWSTSDRKLVLESTNNVAVSTTSITSNVWTHVAVSVSNGTATFYINGAAAGTGVTTLIDNSSVGLNVGAFADGNFPYSGSLADLRLWNTARTASEIQNNANSYISNNAALVLNYRFDNTSGSSVTDYSTNSRNGTVNYSPSWSNIDKPTWANGSLALSGSNYVSVSNPDIYQFTGGLRKYASITADFGSTVTINGIRMANFSGLKDGSTTVTPNFTGGIIESSTDGTNWTSQISNIPSLPAVGSTLPVNSISARYIRVRRDDETSGAYYGLSELAFISGGYETVPYIRTALPADATILSGTSLSLSGAANAIAGQTISSYQWSSSTTAAGTFNNLSNGAAAGVGTISGAASSDLSISNYTNGNPTYYRITATQADGCVVSSQTLVNLETVPYYPTTTGVGTLQNTSSWTVFANGSVGSVPSSFAANKFFILQNSGSGNYTITSDWTNDGTLRLNSNSLTLTSTYNATLANIDGYSSSAFIKTNGTGYLRSLVSNTAKVFPVGNTRYSPVTITNNLGTAEIFFVNVSEGVTSPGTTSFLNKTWKIKKTNSTTSGGTNLNIDFEWNALDVSGAALTSPMVFYSSSASGPWTELIPSTHYASISIASNKISITGFKGILGSSDVYFIVKNAVPKVTSISPNTTGAGQTVVITGTGFSGASSVSLGGTSVSSYSVNSDTQITATVGSGTTGNTVVTTMGGPSTQTVNFTFVPAPTISSFTAVREQIGGRITITGTNFTSVTGVTIGGVAATSYQVVSNTSINAFVPVGATDGSVAVTTLGGTATKTGFSIGFSTPQDPGMPALSNLTVNLFDRQTSFATPFTRSNGAITISTPANNGVADYVSGQILFKGVGTTTLTVSQASTLDYQAVTRTATITVRDYPVINFTDLSSNVGDPSINLTATSNSTGAFTYSSDNTAVATIAGNALTPTGSGATVITASQAAAGNYLAAQAKAILIVKDPNKADPTISWVSTINKRLDDGSFTIDAALSNSTGAFRYISSNPQVATISNRTITIVGNGVTVLTALQEETNTYNAAKVITLLIVGDPYKASPQLSGLANYTKLVTDPAFTITAPTTLSSASIQYVIGNDKIASISGNTITLKSNGSTKIYAIQKETGTHQAGMIESTLQVNLPPAPVVQYSNALNKQKGSAITAINPTSTGGVVTNYSIWPPLPSGLTLNAQTGSIQGTPTILSTERSYQVTATNLGGQSQASFNLSVIDIIPSALTYTTPLVYTVGQSITPELPTVSGGAVVEYTVSPALPSGLTLNTLTGEISGTPNAIAASATYTITATNSGGSTTGTLSITVNDIAPTALSYPTPNTLVKNNPITAIEPIAAGGKITQFVVVGTALPNGLTLNQTTGAITGTPTTVFDQATFTIRGSNASGFIDATVDIICNDAEPNFTYTSPVTLTKGSAMTALLPTNTGGDVISYKAITELPAGLSLNTLTGEISGTPTALSADQPYTIRAYNFMGTFDFDVHIAVVDVAPSALSYTTPNVFIKGSAITTITPTVSGGAVVSYAVSPSLPAGLTLNTSTGEISGTPTVTAAQATYTVTATNTGGNTTATIDITVNDTPPSALSFTTPNVFTKGTAITTLNPTVSGGAVTSYTISPSLPAGLTLNSTTGSISGTPTAITASANYTITATNSGGSTTTTVGITVNDVVPSALSYTTPNVYTKGSAITALTPIISGGAVVSYSINPSLPAGLSFNTTTGVISGTPTVLSAQTDYTVTATNTGGSTTAIIRITINDVAPSSLSYNTPNVYTKGSAITSLTPTISGGAVTGYSINPALPAGLSINSSTGVISGTPTAVSTQTTYTISAVNTGGTTTASIVLKVNDVAPSSLSYTSPNVFTKGTTITSLTPTVNGGTVIGYSVSPALPAGLTINNTTGVISGTPTTISTQTNYVITAQNSGGSTTATISIKVNDVAPGSFSYGNNNSISFTQGVAITPIGPSSTGGTVTSYTISPALPAGLSFDPTTGVISGTPTGLSASANYTITASNSGGNVVTNITLAIVDVAPSSLNYSTTNQTVRRGAAITPMLPSSSGGAVTSYTISPALPAGLTLDPLTGAITGSLTANVTGTVTYTITAANSGGLTSSTITFVFNTAPTDLLITPSGVNENLSIGSLVGAFATTDADAGDSFTYALVSGVGSTDNNQFTIAGNLLRTAAVFDFETKSSYSIRVRVTDAGGLTFEKQLTISINDIDTEDTDGDGVPDFQEKADGTDFKDPRSYKDSDGDGVPDFIEIRDGSNPLDGKSYKDTDGDGVPDHIEIKDGTNPLDRTSFKDSDGDGVPDFVETILYPIYGLPPTNPLLPGDKGGDSDGDGISDFDEIKLGQNPLDKPRDLFYTPTLQLSEQGKAMIALTPTVVGKVSTYSISPAIAGGLSINTTTGVISGTRTQSMSGKVAYTITATNAGGSTSASITINYNTAPSDLNLSKANTFENNKIGDVIGTMTTSDIDVADVHTYTLEKAAGDDLDNKYFKIVGNKLLADAVFVSATRSSYQVNIRSTDPEGLFTEKRYTITITPMPVISGTHSEAYIGSTYTGTSNTSTRPIISKGYSSQLEITGRDIARVSWSAATGLSSTTSLRPIFKYGSTVSYIVTVTNIYGSTVDIPFTVEVRDDYFVKPTNILTTRKDGINDYFVIENIENYPDNEVTIFDRQGRILTQFKNYNNRWDGTLNGKYLSTDTYYYMIRFTSKPSAATKGFITLITN